MVRAPLYPNGNVGQDMSGSRCGNQCVADCILRQQKVGGNGSVGGGAGCQVTTWLEDLGSRVGSQDSEDGMKIVV